MFGQLPLKARWQDAPLALRDFLAETINTIHLISIEQLNEEGNTLRTDLSNNRGNFNSYLKLVLFLLP